MIDSLASLSLLILLSLGCPAKPPYDLGLSSHLHSLSHFFQLGGVDEAHDEHTVSFVSKRVRYEVFTKADGLPGHQVSALGLHALRHVLHASRRMVQTQVDLAPR